MTLKYPKSNFHAILPRELKKQSADIVVFQTGSIEITNIDVKKAMMDPNRDINDYEAEWFKKVEDDSANLFDLAQTVTKENPDTQVVILKRLPRFDPLRHDPLKIKRKLSSHGNNMYDKIWKKSGSPTNITITSLKISNARIQDSPSS